MQAHSQLTLVCRAGQSQLILVENGADCRSERFRLQVVTTTGSSLPIMVTKCWLNPMQSGGQVECNFAATKCSTSTLGTSGGKKPGAGVACRNGLLLLRRNLETRKHCRAAGFVVFRLPDHQ